MKTFKRKNLEEIVYQNETYKLNISISSKLKTPNGSLENVKIALKEKNLKAIQVHCMHNNLIGKSDFHGKPYVPNVWIFTN
jgi:hypothetical protein